MTTKLPRSLGDRKLTDHPVVLARKHMAANGVRRVQLAKILGVSPQSALGFETRAAADRDYLLPAEHVKHYSRLGGLPPHVFRPDVFEPDWSYPAAGSSAPTPGGEDERWRKAGKEARKRLEPKKRAKKGAR